MSIFTFIKNLFGQTNEPSPQERVDTPPSETIQTTPSEGNLETTSSERTQASESSVETSTKTEAFSETVTATEEIIEEKLEESVTETVTAVEEVVEESASEAVTAAEEIIVETIEESVPEAATAVEEVVAETIEEPASEAVTAAEEIVVETIEESAPEAVTAVEEIVTETIEEPASEAVTAAQEVVTQTIEESASETVASFEDESTESTTNVDAITSAAIAGAAAATTSAAREQPATSDTEQNTTMKHVIIGTGPAGVIAAETIRKLDPMAAITLIGDEPEPPYSRMAIPYLLEENINESGTYLRKTDGHYIDNSINIIQDRVSALNVDSKTLTLENSADTVEWDRLLVATGSEPIVPPIPGLDNKKVSNCWTLEDARQIIDGVKPDSVVVQIGAGFIGCIILESLVRRGAKLTVVEMGDRMVPRMLDQQCGTMLKNWCENQGVTVLTSAQVSSIEDSGDRLKVSVSGNEPIEADFVISATGVRANTAFLDGSGIEIDEGIMVDRYLQTNIPDVYAAGDVAQGIDFSTGEYTVQAIQPTATEHGMIAAKNMVAGNTTKHKGSVLMNVLATLGLISVSYGLWEGVEGGESVELADADNFRYIRLQFEGDKLIGANTLGITQNIGAIRGLIQSQTALGVWKERLMDNPLHFMEAYVGVTGGHT